MIVGWGVMIAAVVLGVEEGRPTRATTSGAAWGGTVMFAIRPFWRWQTQGNFFLGFNAILNWNDLDAAGASSAVTDAQGSGDA